MLWVNINTDYKYVFQFDVIKLTFIFKTIVKDILSHLECWKFDLEFYRYCKG